jgi:hypothetical protein
MTRNQVHRENNERNISSEEVSNQFNTEAGGNGPDRGPMTAPQMVAPVIPATQIPEAVKTAINAVSTLQFQVASVSGVYIEKNNGTFSARSDLSWLGFAIIWWLIR